MFTEQKRYGRDPATVVRAAPATFNAPLKWSEPRLIFTCSWSDWFHTDADEWRDEAWDVIRRCPQHTFQILTKRPRSIARRLPPDWADGWPNVWLGTSVESQEYLWRAAVLAEIPAAVRFVSAEPLLGPVDFGWSPFRNGWRGGPLLGRISWVIAGGESGAHARPCDLDWLRSLRDQCGTAGVAYYLKQLGGHPDKRADDKAVLDGRTWTEMPWTAPVGARH